MFGIALRTMRARRASSAGASVAIALAVGLVSATGLLMASVLATSGAGRFAGVDAVVQANATIMVGQGDPAGGVVTVHPPPPLPAAIVARVQAVSGVRRAVGDLAFPATAVGIGGRILSARGADRTEGHGWASAALTPYALVAGRPPASADQVVVDSRLAAAGRMVIGQELRVVAPGGIRAFRVSGIAVAKGAGAPGQSALFFTSSVASALAGTRGHVNAVGVLAAPGISEGALIARLRAQLGPGLKVQDRQHAADADAGDPRAAQRDDAIGFLGTMGAFAGVVAVFVVGSTFAFAVAQRRRELALMRLIGATPNQLRRMIAGEALAVAIMGGAVGCAAGFALAVPIARALVSGGVAPEGFHAAASWIPLLVGFGTGLLVCEIAVAAAAWRAARVRPAESLREALLERRGLGPVRWLLGLLAVGGAAALIVTVPVGGALAGPAALLLAIGIALLAPLVLGFPAAALSFAPRAGGAAPGLLASTAMAANRRRVGAIAAPIVLVVALAGTQAVIDGTTRATLQDTTAKRVHAPYVLVARAGDGLPPATVRLAQRLPGVRAAVGIMPTTVFLLDPGLDNYGSPWNAAGIDPAKVSGGLDLDVLAGSLTSLHGDTVAVSSELAAHRNLHVGAVLTARLADLTRTRLRVGAIFGRALGLGDLLLPGPLAEGHAATKLDSAVFIAGPPVVRPELRRLVTAVPTAAALSRAQYLNTIESAARASAWPQWLLIGLIIAFAALAMVNTTVMATAGRQRELALVRLAGATRRQARRAITWEALITTLIGVGAGAAIARLAVRTPGTGPAWHITVPPALFGGILTGAALLGMIGSLLPARLILRPDPMTTAKDDS
jgi:putative ABC transport system permease protein